MEPILYQPFQRLDYYFSKNLNKIFIRARVYVMLYDQEEIDEDKPTAHPSGSNESIMEFKVEGNNEVLPVGYPFTYLIHYKNYTPSGSDPTDVQIKGQVESEIEGELGSNKYFVTTIIKKNPTGTTTNTIDKDGDIEVGD
jgi:hypothetical protein